MSISPRKNQRGKLPLFDGAAQHVPRPLPLLLQLLEQEGHEKRVDLSVALAGLRRYQRASPALDQRTPLAIYAHNGPVKLWRSRRWEAGRPWILLVPSIINGPEILDLGDGISLLDWLSDTHNVLLADWGNVCAKRSEEDFETLVTGYLTPLVADIAAQQGQPPHLMGYCLGGLFALALSHFVETRSLALVAAPWDFSAYGEEQLAALRHLWATQQSACTNLGCMPFELLQSGFWMLEPDRVAAKYASAAAMDAERFARFQRVENWANGGQPLMLGAARDLMEGFVTDNLAASGAWRMGGCHIAGVPDGLSCLSIRSTNDRIVPHTVSASFGETRDVSSGHIGMMVGGRRKEQLWQPLTRWFTDQSVQTR